VLGPIDEALAQQGAILFHSKNLWEPSLHNPVARPAGGNGSCAGCHGAISPRYVHDKTYLATPDLEGIGGYVTPIDIAGTDSRRLDGDNEGVYRSARNSWFAYRDQPQCGDQNDPQLRGDRQLGYLAPPLYGVWATAPYFHNGAVPSVWEVLKPSDRHDIWRRVSKSAPAGQESLVMGFDTDLARAYDAQHLGWKYDPIVQIALSGAYANGGVFWNVTDPPILNDAQIEQRKIYNTHVYSQSNAGHQFTSVLTDQERRALIEYLKTL
jgi:mono/diheme cytochrome c family protein